MFYYPEGTTCAIEPRGLSEGPGEYLTPDGYPGQQHYPIFVLWYHVPQPPLEIPRSRYSYYMPYGTKCVAKPLCYLRAYVVTFGGCIDVRTYLPFVG